MTPRGDVPGKRFLSTSKPNLNKLNVFGESSDYVQLCPNCKKLVKETDLVCPYCNTPLSSHLECPFCKNEIDEQDTVCPHCDRLLIYEQPKKVTARRNAVLIPLGGLLLVSALVFSYLDWKGIKPSGPLGVILMLLWLAGFVFYGAYIGKGDKDFWFG